MGVVLDAAPSGTAPVLGLKLAGGTGEARVANVYDEGAAQAAGVSAGDVLLALDGLRIADAKALEAMLVRRRAGDTVRLHAFRRDELMQFELVLDAPPVDKYSLSLAPRANAAAVSLQRGWLGN